MKKMMFWLSSIWFAASVQAAQYTLPSDGSNIVGQAQTATAKRRDTLGGMAVRYGVGYNEMAKANPKWRGRRIPAGTAVTIPTQHKLPSATHNGIVINLADMRLFYYPPGGGSVYTFPVAVGKRGWSTPRGTTSVIAKRRNPTWTPPASIRREAARRGKRLRKVYPAGPNNPLGTRALRLGLPGYLIHGTNKPWSIGRRVSHGCIRMRRRDIEQLFSLVPVNTPVTIVSEGTKLNYGNAGSLPRATAQSYAAPKTYRAKKSKKHRKTYVAAKRHTKQNGTSYRAKKSYNRTYKATRRARTSQPYISNRGFDYKRLNNDISNGTTNTIDLSGL